MFSPSLRLWAEIQDSVSNTCLLFTDWLSTTTPSKGLEMLLCLARTKCMQIVPSLTSLQRTHLHSTNPQTSKYLRHTHTRGQTTFLRYTPLLPDDYPVQPIITHISTSLQENLHSSAAKQQKNCDLADDGCGDDEYDDDHTSYVSFLFFHKLPAG